MSYVVASTVLLLVKRKKNWGEFGSCSRDSYKSPSAKEVSLFYISQRNDVVNLALKKVFVAPELHFFFSVEFKREKEFFCMPGLHTHAISTS